MKQSILKLFAAVLFCSVTHVKPVSENVATYCPIAGGVVAGGLAGAGTYYCLTKKTNMSEETNALLAVLAGCATGGLTWWMLDSWLSKLTPRAHYKAAMKLVAYVEADSLVSQKFSNEEELVSRINTRFGTGDPLKQACDKISSLEKLKELVGKNPLEQAFDKISSLDRTLTRARRLLAQAYQEASGKPEYTTFCSDCKNLEARIDQCARRVAPLFYFIDALRQFVDCEYDSLISRNFSNEEEFFSHINVRFGTDWPLRLAREQSLSLAACLMSARTGVIAAKQEALKSPENPENIELCLASKNLQARIDKLSQRIEAQVNVIVHNKDYQFQIKLYEKHREAERERAHQAQLQQNEQAHQAKLKRDEQWHDSSERAKDRNLTRNLHRDEKFHEFNNKIIDQEFKQAVLTNHNGPVTLTM